MSKYILLLFCIVQINIYCQSIYKNIQLFGEIYRTYLIIENVSRKVTDLSSIITKYDISKPLNAKYSSLLPPTFNPSASKDLWEVLHGAEPNKDIFSNVGSIRNADGTLQANRILMYQEDLRKIIDAIEAAKDSEEALTTFKLGDIQPFAAADGLVSGIYPMDAKITGESGLDRFGITFESDKINRVYTPNTIVTRPFLFPTYSPIQINKVTQNQILLINPWNERDVFSPLNKLVNK